MSWGLILLLAAIVFCNRYVFLGPRVPVKLPALLEQGAVRPFPDNPYLWGALASVVLASLAACCARCASL